MDAMGLGDDAARQQQEGLRFPNAVATAFGASERV